MPTTTRRYYSNAAIPATLTADVNATQTTITVSTVVGLPTSFPFAYTLDRNSPGSIEVVEVTALTGTTLTVTRGVDGTTGKTHTAGSPAEHTSVARDFDTTNNHASTSSVSTAHGSVVQADVTGGYLDLTNAQTAAGNKTFSNNVTVNGTLSEGTNRVYSAGNAPPYPVTSVATRTGAVTLTAADIGVGTFPSGGFAIPGTLSFGSTTRQMLNMYGTEYALGVQASTLYSRTAASGNFAWFAGGTHNDAAVNAGGGTTLASLSATGLAVTGNITSPTYIYAHNGTNEALRLGEVHGDAGLYAGSDQMGFHTTGTRGWRWAVDNANRMTLDASGNLAITGGMTVGTTLSAAGVVSGAGFDTLFEDFRATAMVHGGGTITLDASANLRWTQRLIAIAHRGSRGHFDITMPADGTVITGVNGAANQTVVAGGIPMAGTDGWVALYYVTSLSTYRLSGYTSTNPTRVAADWVLIAARNGDTGTVFVNPLKRNMRPGESVTVGNANETLAGNKTFSGNIALGSAGTLAFGSTATLSANDTTWTPLKVAGGRGGYSGINFVDAARHFMVSGQYQGIYDGANWTWLWDNGTLSNGTVPWARLSDIPATASRNPTWAEVTSKPATWLDATPTLTGQITDLNTALPSGFYNAGSTLR